MSTIELRQLEYFVAVADHLHFGRAADALRVGQPAVSQQVARLERSLGATLLDRSPRVQLTNAGRQFLPLARNALVAVDRACDAVRQDSLRPLRLGTCSGLGDRLERLLAAVASRCGDVSIELANLPPTVRLERVASGQLDAAFVRGFSEVAGVVLIKVWHDRLLAAVPAEHPLAGSGVAQIADLLTLPLRIVSRSANPPLVDAVLRVCADAGRAPRRIEHDGGSVESVLASLASGSPSWTVVYESHARILRPARVSFVPTDPAVEIPTYLAVSENASSRAVAELLEACEQACRLLGQ